MDEQQGEFSPNPGYVHVPQWHAAVLAARKAAVTAGDAVFIDWEEAKRRLEKRCASAPEQD